MPSPAHGALLSIDLGTLSAKVGLFSERGELLGMARHAYPLDRSDGDGRVEQDPELWWAAIRDGIRAVLQGHDPGLLKAVCVGGQGPTLVLVDSDGLDVRPAISWMDRRASEQGIELTQHHNTNRATYS